MNTAGTPLVVAIDGPAGAGKSTVARRLARELGVPFVDTGAMYRAAALHLLEKGIDPDDRQAVADAVGELPVELAAAAADVASEALVLLDGQPVDERIRTAGIGALTSRVAVHPELRAFMVEKQRAFVARFGGVMEGRDIGTVVVPDAFCKFYLEASAATRAARRVDELRGRGETADFDDLCGQLLERDERDRSRHNSPLIAAGDAIRVETDGRTVDEVVELLRSTVASRRASAG